MPNTNITRDHPLCRCLQNNDNTGVITELKELEDVANIRDEYGNTILHLIAEQCSSEETAKKMCDIVTSLLKQYCKDLVNTPNMFRRTPLMVAGAQKHGTEMCTLLLNEGAVIDERDLEMWPAVLHATWQKSLKNVELLLEYGKSMYLKDEKTKAYWIQVLKFAWINDFNTINALLTNTTEQYAMSEANEKFAMHKASESEKKFVLFIQSLQVYVKESAQKQPHITAENTTIEKRAV